MFNPFSYYQVNLIIGIFCLQHVLYQYYLFIQPTMKSFDALHRGRCVIKNEKLLNSHFWQVTYKINNTQALAFAVVEHENERWNGSRPCFYKTNPGLQVYFDDSDILTDDYHKTCSQVVTQFLTGVGFIIASAYLFFYVKVK